jgi:hypothetical protein
MSSTFKHKRAVFVAARCELLWVLLFFFDFKHFSALIMSAVWTDGVRQAHRTTIGTGYQIARFQCVMRTATIAAALGMFAFGMWGHDFLLYTLCRGGACSAPTAFTAFTAFTIYESGQIIAAEGSDVKPETL